MIALDVARIYILHALQFSICAQKRLKTPRGPNFVPLLCHEDPVGQTPIARPRDQRPDNPTPNLTNPLTPPPKPHNGVMRGMKTCIRAQWATTAMHNTHEHLKGMFRVFMCFCRVHHFRRPKVIFARLTSNLAVLSLLICKY